MTTQPAGEHHTGTLNLAGEGNKPATPISDAMADLATDALAIGVRCPPNCDFQTHSRAEMRAVLEAAYPAIRQQVAEQIALAIDHFQKALEDAYDKRGNMADDLRADAAEYCATLARAIGGGA